MKFVPYERKKIDTLTTRNCNLFDFLEGFLASGVECAEVKDYPHKNATCCANAMRMAVRRYRLGIKVCVRGDCVFVIRNPI